MNGKIILTSTGLYSENVKEYCNNLFLKLSNKSVAIITTAAQNSDFKKEIYNLLERGGICIGVSAGSIIIRNSVKIAFEVAPDEDCEVSILDDFDGLKIINADIHPHYSIEDDTDLENYKKNLTYEIETISNSEAIIFENYSKINKIY